MTGDFQLAENDRGGGVPGRSVVRVAGAFVLFGGALYLLNIPLLVAGDDTSHIQAVCTLAFIHFAVALGLWYRLAVARTAAIIWLSLGTAATLVSFPQMPLCGTQFAPFPFYPWLLVLTELWESPAVGWSKMWMSFSLNIVVSTLVVLLLTGKAARTWCNRRPPARSGP